MHKKLESLWRLDARHFIGLLGAELKRYQGTYEKDFRGQWRPAAAPDLFRAISRSSLVFSGDYHTLPAAQRLPIRLLRPFVKEGRRITLALEMLHSKDQGHIDEFLQGKTGSRTLRNRIEFDSRWGFDWMGYQAILEFARKEGIGVIGINTEPGQVRDRLARRDRHAALVLAQHLHGDPDELLFVLAGDWHVARSHLPRQTIRLAKAVGLSPRTLVIHQNHDALYRKFASEAGGIPDVVRRGRDLFCVLNTAPHVKAQSHVRWALETSAADSEADDYALHDPASDFWEIARALAGHLKLPLDLNLSVYGGDDGNSVARTARAASAGEKKLHHWKVELAAGRTVSVPETRTVLLGQARLNHVAEEAGRQLRKPLRSPGRRTRRSNFYDIALDHGAAFFASRLINPLRKCDLIDDLLGHGSGTERQRFEAAWARFFTSGGDAMGITRTGHAFWDSSPRVRRRVARTVGAMWGYYLYDSYIAGRMDPEWVRSLFRGTLRLSPEEIFMRGSCLPGADERVSTKTALL